MVPKDVWHAISADEELKDTFDHVADSPGGRLLAEAELFDMETFDPSEYNTEPPDVRFEQSMKGD